MQGFFQILKRALELFKDLLSTKIQNLDTTVDTNTTNISARISSINTKIESIDTTVQNKKISWAERRDGETLLTGSGTWTVPEDVVQIWRIEMVGGGGGGGGGAWYAHATTPGEAGGGGAGGSGAYGLLEGTFIVTPGQQITYSCGAGGGGGAGGLDGGWRPVPAQENGQPGSDGVFTSCGGWVVRGGRGGTGADCGNPTGSLVVDGGLGGDTGKPDSLLDFWWMAAEDAYMKSGGAFNGGDSGSGTVGASQYTVTEGSENTGLSGGGTMYPESDPPPEGPWGPGDAGDYWTSGNGGANTPGLLYSGTYYGQGGYGGRGRAENYSTIPYGGAGGVAGCIIIYWSYSYSSKKASVIYS